MKSKLAGIVGITMFALCLSACEGSTKPAETVIDMHDNVGEAQDAVDSFKQNGADKDTQAQEILGEGEGEAPAVPVYSQETVGYVFNYNNATLSPDKEFGPMLALLGQSKDYYEVKSCAFEGKDKIYSYGSFDITTYPQGEKDLISYIDFRDDTVTTAEGAYLFMPKDEVLKIYGNGYTEKLGAYCYEKDGMELRFIFESDAVASIQYATLVLDN